jgi:hypothetical protein
MSADQRVTAAREYLGYARQIKFADLPEPAVIRMAVELRRQLGQVLDYVGELEHDTAAELAAVREAVDQLAAMIRAITDINQPGMPGPFGTIRPIRPEEDQ